MNVISFKPRDCQRIRAYLDSYINNELLVETMHDVLRHLEDCPDCTEVLAERERLKNRLQAAVRRDTAPPDLERRIQSRLRNKRPGNWSWMLIAAALVVAIGITSLTLLNRSPNQPVDGDEAEAPPLSAQSAAVLQIGLNDHITCAIDNGFANLSFTEAEIMATLRPEFAPLVGIVQQQIGSDYRIVVGHRCEVRGREFVHLILRNQQQVLSLVITRRKGESYNAGDPAIRELAGLKLYETQEQKMSVTGFETPGYLAFIVSDQGMKDNLQIASRLAPAVRDFLGKVDG